MVSATDSKVSVTQSEDGIVADVQVFAQLAARQTGDDPERSYQMVWSNVGVLTSVDARGRTMESSRALSSKIDSTVLNMASPRNRIDSSVVMLRDLASQRPSTGDQGASMSKGHFVTFLSANELVAARQKIERALGPGQIVGEQIEFNGKTAAGAVTARLNSINSTLEYLRISNESRGTVESSFRYQRVADDVFARTRLEINTFDLNNSKRRSLMSISDLAVSEAR